MLDQVQCANQALGHIGEDDQISDLNEGSKAARTINVHWEPVRLFLLSKINWAFASRTIELAARPADPTFPIARGRTAFPLPAGYIRLIEIVDPDLYDDDDEFSIETGPSGPELVVDHAGPITVRMVQDVPAIREPQRWPPEFIEAFAFRLAWSICDTLSADRKRKSDANTGYLLALRDAKKVNARTRPFRRNPPSDWTRARRRGASGPYLPTDGTHPN